MSTTTKEKSLEFIEGVIEGQRKESIPDTIPLLAAKYESGETTALAQYDRATKTVAKEAEYLSRGGNILVWGAYAFWALGAVHDDITVEQCMEYATLITRAKGEGHLTFKNTVDNGGKDALDDKLAARKGQKEFRAHIQELIKESNTYKLAQTQNLAASLGTISDSRDEAVALDIIKMLGERLGLDISI